ncbi:MAG: ABC transporter permease [Paracoccaceae bacterium]
MTGALRLALAYIAAHWAKSAVLTLAVAVILAVPLSVAALLSAAERQLTARAEATPLMIGARGSRLDLVMSGLYFAEDLPEPVTMAAVDRIWESGLAAAVPLHLGFRAEGAPIVGTTLDYLDARALRLAEGRPFALLGEAVIGADLARRRGLAPGDALVSSPDTLFDLAGAYPLKMTVAGVLEATGTADDRAVFVDIKTAWVIAGIGHGHGDIAAEADPATASAVVEYREITPETIDSFHFHGDPAGYPVTAILALPHDARSGTILRGRYLEADRSAQIVVPRDVIGALLARLVAIKGVIDAVVAAVGGAALVAVGLAGYLSLELRRGEMATAYKIGASRWLIARLVAVETAVLLAAAGALAWAAVAGVRVWATEAVAWLAAAS